MESEARKMKRLELRPNNWFINRAKLDRVREAYRHGDMGILPPILVTYIDGEPSLIDGLARTYAAFEMGRSDINAVVKNIEDIEGSRALYEHIHREGPNHGIRTVADLGDRIVVPEEHECLWIGYCTKWVEEHDAE